MARRLFANILSRKAGLIRRKQGFSRLVLGKQQRQRVLLLMLQRGAKGFCIVVIAIGKMPIFAQLS
jgi:hypothetical protein